MSKQTLVILTTYNEIESLPALVDEIFASAPAVHLLVVDDNSPDGTGPWCLKRGESEPRMRLLSRAGKLGQGSAIVAGMRYALDQGYEFVVTMDADFSHHPRYIPALLARLAVEGRDGADVVIGSRYVAGGRIEGWPWHRHLMSRSVNRYARAMLRLSTRDCSGGFRAYRLARLAQLDYGQLISRGYSFHEEFLWRVKRLGCRLAEEPITFVDRVKGTSKINAREAWIAIRVIFRLGLSERFGGNRLG